MDQPQPPLCIYKTHLAKGATECSLNALLLISQHPSGRSGKPHAVRTVLLRRQHHVRSRRGSMWHRPYPGSQNRGRDAAEAKKGALRCADRLARSASKSAPGGWLR
ncbi:hypothetical protein LIA77_08536 [Sarocladium implicatum]|nr:hypothetical protein LIA77_08536 [Sarocladium implicatum]